MSPRRGEVPEAAANTRSPGIRQSALGGNPVDSESTDFVAQARSMCLQMLTTRPRSRAELARALRRRGIAEEVSASVLDRLGEAGLVDDVAFAETAVHSGYTYRGLGRQALSAELRRRGVPDGIAREAVSAVQPEDEERRARELVRRRLRTTTCDTGDSVTLVRRLIGMLARKGYSAELALRMVRDELGPDRWPEEWSAEIPTELPAEMASEREPD